MSLLRSELNDLVKTGQIYGWKLQPIDCDGILGQESERESCEVLEIVFPNHQTLKLQTFCSGYKQNSGFVIHDG